MVKRKHKFTQFKLSNIEKFWITLDDVSLSSYFWYFHFVLNLEGRTMCYGSYHNIIAQSMIVDSRQIFFAL